MLLPSSFFFFFLIDPPTTEISPLPLPDALPILRVAGNVRHARATSPRAALPAEISRHPASSSTWPVSGVQHRASRERRVVGPRQLSRRSEEHTSELQSRLHLVCRLLLEKKKNKQ